jgi:hypothetical protein
MFVVVMGGVMVGVSLLVEKAFVVEGKKGSE